MNVTRIHTGLFFFMLMLPLSMAVADDGKLTGSVIGTTETVDYSTFGKSYTVNTREMAFDGNPSTFFASWERSYTWVGLDLGAPHVITKVGWSPRNDVHGEERVVLGVFEGANREDFMDALPIYIITERGHIGEMTYADTDCSAGFRYVRYVGPSDARCNIAELEFHGHPGEGDSSRLYRPTNLPTVSIHTLDGVIPFDKETDITAQITIIGGEGEELLSAPGGIRERGNYSRNFPKKPYRIKFDKKQRILDAPAKAKKWTLINNYGDKTLMRNLLAFELSRCLGMPYTPYGRSVDVLVNGEYKGNYQLCDHIDEKKNRVELIDTVAEGSSDSLSTAFLIEADARASTEACWFTSKKGTPMTIHYPDDDEITPLQKNYIENCFNAMEADWKKYLDTNTFIRHFLVGELSGNTDTYWSTYMYKHRENDTIYTGPVWDFDIAFENDNRTYPINSKKDFVYRSGGSTTGNMRSFVDNIIVRDAEAKAKMLKIWGEAREASINERHLVGFINQQEEYLEESQKLNFMRWPIMESLVHQNPVAWGSYAAEVQNVRRFISERLLWMDSKLGYTYEPNGIRETAPDLTRAYQLFDLSGRSYTDDLHRLPRGIYIVKQGSETRKIQVR